MVRARRARAIEDLEPGDHLCCIYETAEERLAVLCPFLLQGLDEYEKVLYIGDINTTNDVLDRLSGTGFDTGPCLESGQLFLQQIANTFLEYGFFDPDMATAYLWEEKERAREEGYSGFRIAGEMLWRSWEPPGSERLIEYEAKLGAFLEANQCTALCLYHRESMPPEVLLGALATHPAVVVGTDTDIRENFYYIPSEVLLGSSRPGAILRRWLDNLTMYERKGDRG